MSRAGGSLVPAGLAASAPDVGPTIYSMLSVNLTTKYTTCFGPVGSLVAAGLAALGTRGRGPRQREGLVLQILDYRRPLREQPST